MSTVVDIGRDVCRGTPSALQRGNCQLWCTTSVNLVLRHALEQYAVTNGYVTCEGEDTGLPPVAFLFVITCCF